MFTDERKRLNGQVGRLENDGTSFLPFAPSCSRERDSPQGVPKGDILTITVLRVNIQRDLSSTIILRRRPTNFKIITVTIGDQLEILKYTSTVENSP